MIVTKRLPLRAEIDQRPFDGRPIGLAAAEQASTCSTDKHTDEEGPRVTEQPGWESPSRPPGDQPAPPRPPPSTDWAADQPAPHGWGDPGYGQQPGHQTSAPPPPAGGQQPGWGQQPAPAWGQQPGWLPPKPGVIPLRPLGVGEILDGAISTIRAKPRLMLGLSAVLAVLTQLITVPITWFLLHDAGDRAFSFEQNSTFNQTTGGAQTDFAFTVSSLTAATIQLMVTLVATLLLTGILTVVLSRAVLGQDIDGQQAWAQARPRLLALVGVTIFVFLIGIGVTALFLGPGIALAVAGAPAVAIALAFLLGVPGLLCALPYLYVSFALAPAVVVLEKQPIIASLTRSRRLVQGAWWRTFAILVLVNIIASVVGGIFAGIFQFAAFLTAGVGSGFSNFNPYELLPLVIIGVGTIIGAAITWPFTAVASALIYVDRRIRREGLDLELARAAGYTAPDQSRTPGGPPADAGHSPASYGG
jgi:hypothetical protein